MYSNRSIVLIIIATIVFVHGALYALTMYAVYANGLVPHDFISTDSGDSYEYVALAQTMLSDGRFAMSSISAPETFRTPAYPLFISGILATTKDIVYVPLFQIILSALSAALIFLICVRFFTRSVGVTAALLFAIDPAGPMVTFVSMADMLFVFLLLIGTYTLVKYEPVVRWQVFLSGVVIGVSVLTRPIGLYIFPLYVAWLLWGGRYNWKQAFKIAGIFLAGVFLVVAPWIARNYEYSGHATISSIGVYNFLFYNIIDFEHERTGVSKETIHADILKQIDATRSDDFRSLTYTDKVSAVALKYLLAHPFEYTAFHLLSIIPFYIGSSIDAATYAVYSRGAIKGTISPDINVSSLVLHGNYRAALVALTDNMPKLIERIIWLILCVASFGMTAYAVYRKKPNASVVVLFFAFIVAFGILTGPVSYPRYRLPAEPFIFILGVAGIMSLLRYMKGIWYSCSYHGR
jgi:hypothetical protein